MTKSKAIKKPVQLSTTLGLYVAIGVVTALALGFLVIKPQFGDVAGVNSQVTVENQKITDLHTLDAQTQQLSQNYTSVKTQRDAILDQLPVQSEEERLVALLSDISQQTGVVLNTFEPQGSSTGTSAATSSSLSLYGASVGVSGTYAQVQAFLQQVETSARFIDVQGATLADSSSGIGGSNPAIDAQLSLQAYYQSNATTTGASQ